MENEIDEARIPEQYESITTELIFFEGEIKNA